MIGLWLDRQADEVRDRIVVAQGWGFGGGCGPEKYDLIAGRRCLMDNAAGRGGAWIVAGFDRHEVAERFDALCHRVGLARAVELVKARAGARIAIDLPLTAKNEPEATPEHVERVEVGTHG